MVQALGSSAKKVILAAALTGLFALAASAQDDPPTRVARLNYMNGNVSMEPAGVDDWAPAAVNRPFTTGDYIYTDDGAQAELHMDVAVIRMGSQTSFGFLNLGDQVVQMKVTEGDVYIRIRNFSSDQVFEVDTPNGAVTLLQNGVYRFRVDPNGTSSYVVVRDGQAQVTGGGQAFLLNQNESANISGTDQMAYDVETAPSPDDFDNWSSQRDAHEASLPAAQYVSPDVIGYEDLDDNGDWQQSGDYGAVWYPRGVEAGWAPYHNGRWVWIDPWGWTWQDDMSWGFAPFHYGRWAYINNRWGWTPGPRGQGRPYYAPAMVAWFGGSHWGVSVGIGGGGPSLGWLPLGYGEVYTPPYTCSQRYFSDVNVYNTRVTNVNITNVYNTVYVNHTVYNQTFVNGRAPNAVMSMPQSAFASGQSVRQAARPIPAAHLAQIQAARVIAPPVAPTRQSLIPAAGGRAAARPPAAVMQRQVVARVAPPPPRASFAARQQYLQQHAASGQPLNHSEMVKAVPAPHVAAAARVVSAPAAKPVAAHPGARVGNPVVASRPGTVPQPGHAAPAAQPGRPGQPAAHGAPPNRPEERPAAQPAARTPQPPPARPEERPAQPAAHGGPPNRPGERPAEQPAARTPQPPPARPEEKPAQPAAHGAPPNRPEERPATQPAARTPQPAPARPAEKPAPQPAARTPQPAPARPAEKPAPQPAARTPQPAPARPAEKPAPQPAARTPQPPPARPEERPAQPAAHGTPPPSRPAAEPKPAARPEAKPAPAPHEAPPAQKKETKEKDTKDTKH